MIARAARSLRRRARLMVHAAQAGLGAFDVNDAELLRALGLSSQDEFHRMAAGKDLRFFFLAQEKGRLAGRFATDYPEAARAVIAQADAACRHEFCLLGAGGMQNADPAAKPTAACCGAECRPRSKANGCMLRGRVQNAEQNVPWHTDIGTGRRWKKRYSALLPVQYDSDESDIKRVWELSRCQHFGALGQAHLLSKVSATEITEDTENGEIPLLKNSLGMEAHTSLSSVRRSLTSLPLKGGSRASSVLSVPSVAEDTYAAEWVAQMLDWDRENPPLIGPNWMAPMEAAIRIVNWIWGYAFMSDSSAVTEEARRVFYRNLLSHGRFIMRHVEDYGNHRFSNFVGLVWLGVLFPEFKEAPEWRAVGLKGLCEELRKQVRADGCHFEGSIPYHRLVLEMAATTWLLLRRNGMELPQESQNAITRMFEFTAAYLQPNGFAPQMGDADDGRLQELTPLDKRDHSYLLSLAAVLTPGSGFRVQEEPHPEAFWILGEEGLKAYAALPFNGCLHRGDAEHAEDDGPMQKTTSDIACRSLRPLRLRGETSVAFPESGFYVPRSPRLHVFVSCRRPDPHDVGAHSHNDHLSFTLTLDGVEFIVDSGTYTYTGNLETRNEFRATKAHNTIMVDEREINALKQSDPFRLKDRADCRVTDWRTDDRETTLSAHHDGYAPLGVRVARTFLLDRRQEMLTIRDEVTGAGRHKVEWRFHFAPEVKVQLAGRELHAERDGRSLCIAFNLRPSAPSAANPPLPPSAPCTLHSAPQHAAVGFAAGSALLPGWYSPSYGVKQRSLMAVMTATVNLPVNADFRALPQRSQRTQRKAE